MKLFTAIALALGLALFAWLLAHFGALEVFAGAAAAGWGILWVSLYRFVTIAVHGAGWRALFPAGAAPPFGAWFRARWVGEAVNALLPVAQVGGDVARAHLVARHATSGAVAGATVAVDFTLGLAAQFLYAVLGVTLLAGIAGGAAVRGFFTGLIVAALVLAGLFLFLQSGVLAKAGEWLARRQSTAWSSLGGGASEIVRQVAAIYADRCRVAACFGLRLLAWLLLTAETWLILYFLGHPVDWARALVLESLTAAVRSAAFVLPGALGVQEAGFVLMGPMLGVNAETALALALVKRVREILVSVPGLWVWAVSEGRRAANLFPGRQ